MMIHLKHELENVGSVLIAGHIRPDGDALGSCLGLYHFIREQFPGIKTAVLLDGVPEAFSIIPGYEDVSADYEQEAPDLFFSLDCADLSRLGKAVPLFEQAHKTICIDHHISNVGFADENYIVPDASSTSELVARLIDEADISKNSATALYFGIVHDTGVFRHSSTSPETMEIAAKLMRRGINCSKIINQTYYDKSYNQKQILGKALLESDLMLDGKMIVSSVTQDDMKFYNVSSSDLDGIVETLKGTIGVEVALFLYETEKDTFKVSLRSSEYVDVSRIASYFGGGGHVRAAGCSMSGSSGDVISQITGKIKEQMTEAGVL